MTPLLLLFVHIIDAIIVDPEKNLVCTSSLRGYPFTKNPLRRRMKYFYSFKTRLKVLLVFLVPMVLLIAVSVLAIFQIMGNQANAGSFLVKNLFQNPVTLIILTLDLLAMGIGLFLAVMTSRSISGPLTQLSNSMEKLAVGDQNRNSTTRITEAITGRNDEVGSIGRAFIGISDYMIGAVEAAERIASGDLSVEIHPYSDLDELGVAFRDMTIFLGKSVEKIADEAAIVNKSSAYLAQAAQEAGQSTSQIAVTVEQVARGTTEQSESINKAVKTVDQLVRAIEGIAQGAQEQSGATNKAAEITTQLSKAIDQVARNAQIVVEQAGIASKAAKKGSDKVMETLEGMRGIKQSVDLSAEKIQIMGTHSDQIGDIIDTIEDIASQTNLLALNAAIEAARAGEAGKGFAVVADEVRKLAEKSTVATKEIGSLIRSIQDIVAESVVAMEQGVREVERGVGVASEAGETLTEILTATEEVNLQADQSAAAAIEMASSANELVVAVDTVSAVVEENTASTEEMAAGSTEVSESIESIAAVAQENSASVEEVAAAANQMSINVAEVSDSANELANLARQLQEIVLKFKLT